MKYINHILYLEFTELIAVGVSELTLKAARRDEVKCWQFLDDPDDGRKVLIQYSTLKDQYKTLVIAKYGEPHKYFASTIIKQQLINKQSDVDFITTYSLPDGTNLPSAKQADYITACSFLNLLSTSTARSIRDLGFTTAADFFEAVCGIIKSDSISLPTSYRKLKIKIADYKSDGPACVISKKWCNVNAKKLRDEVCEATLLEMISHHAQFDDAYISIYYNKWADNSGRRTITSATVGNYRRKNLLTITASREGVKPYHNQFTPVTKRKRPSAPLYLINSDDNILDLYFRNGNDSYFRFTLVVVIDAFNDYPLGYAIGNGQTKELVQAAYLNAIHHIREITGEQLLWKQIQTDSWGLKALRDWYERQAVFTPTKTGNARGKVIEQSFGKNWHRMLKAYPNYAGHNITAQERLNADALQRNIKEFPTVQDALGDTGLIAHFFNRLRNEVDERKGISRQQQWLQAFHTMLPEQKKQLSDADRLLLFGMNHNYTNKLTAEGFNVAIRKEQLRYDVRKEDYIKHVGKTMQVIYDPYDLTHVLATMDDGRVRVLCRANVPMAMAIADMHEGDRAMLNVKLKEKKEIWEHSIGEQNRRKEILELNKISAEGLLQAGVMLKEQRHLAEHNYLQSQNDEMQPVDATAYPQEEEDRIDLMMNEFDQWKATSKTH